MDYNYFMHIMKVVQVFNYFDYLNAPKKKKMRIRVNPYNNTREEK